MKLAYYHFTGIPAFHEELPISVDILEQWQSDSDLEAYQLNQSENDRTYQIGADFEKSLLQTVENGDTEYGRKYGFSILGIRNIKMHMNPSHDTVLNTDETMLVLGNDDELQRYFRMRR